MGWTTEQEVLRVRDDGISHTHTHTSNYLFLYSALSKMVEVLEENRVSMSCHSVRNVWVCIMCGCA